MLQYLEPLCRALCMLILLNITVSVLHRHLQLVINSDRLTHAFHLQIQYSVNTLTMFRLSLALPLVFAGSAEQVESAINLHSLYTETVVGDYIFISFCTNTNIRIYSSIK